MPEIVPLGKNHVRSGFDCGVPELNTFLKATARQHEQKGISRTFVLTDGTPDILGFFTLTLCEVQNTQLPTVFSGKYPTHPLPAVRLARLAVSCKSQGRGYGELLLSEAVYRTARIAEQAGTVGLFVDAKNDAAKMFYQKYGFLPVPDLLFKLFLPITTIRTSVL